MSDEIKKIEEAIAEQKKYISEAIDKQENGVKNRFVETEAKLQDQIKAADAKLNAYESEKKEMLDRLEKMEVKMNRPAFEQGMGEIKATPGYQFVVSEAYKNAQGSKRPATASVEVGSLFGYKTLVGDGTDRAPVYSDRIQELFFDPGQRAMTLRSIMTTGATTSNAVDYFIEKTFNEDGAASQDGEGSAKAQQNMGFDKKTAPVETIAAWLPVSRQVLDDQAMLQSHIDGRLTYAVEREMERQIIFGDGNDGELTGIWNTPGVATIGAPAGTDTGLDHIRKAIRDVRLSEYGATAIVLNPSDWADLELIKETQGMYVWANVNNGGEPRLWRVPVIESTVMDEGRFLVGAFGIGAQLWDRQTASIRLSDSHSTYFTQNLIAVLAEMRVALTVPRPKAFVRGTFDGAVST